MAVGTGSGGTARRRSSGGAGRAGCVVFLWALVFGAGFYCGIRAIKWAMTGPLWAHSLFGLPMPPTPAPITTAPTPAPPVTTPPPPTTTQPTSVPQPTTAPPNNTNPVVETPPPHSGSPQSKPTDPFSNGDATAEKENTGLLDRQVKDYNNLLRRIQTAQKNYDSAQRAASKAEGKPSEQQTALDRQNNYQDELVATIQQAQSLLDTIQGNALFADRYQETDPVLSPDRIPSTLSELPIGNLKFLRPR